MQKDIGPALADMRQTLTSLPEPHASLLSDKFKSVIDIVSHNDRDTAEQIATVMKLLEQAKLDMQYIIFDLEATARERAVLQAKLDNILGNSNDPEL
jgi:signal transduction histidine kinase